MGVAYINLWSKMQETDGWQKKFLWFVTTSTQEIYTMTKV
jgi:hypothetical protein